MARRKYRSSGLCPAVAVLLFVAVYSFLLYRLFPDDSTVDDISNIRERDKDEEELCTKSCPCPPPEPRHCVQKTNFVFVKMHKCATEMLTSVFHRYGDERDLEFVIPSAPLGEWYLGWPYPITKQIYRPSKSGTFNIMCEHVVFDKVAMSKVMPEDTVYVTILREPFSHFKSSFNFHGVARIAGIRGDDPMDEFFRAPGLYDDIYTTTLKAGIPNGISVTRNFLAHDLGYPKRQWENMTYAKEFVRYIDQEFYLVMILEHLMESLLLLKRLMCWEIQDLLHYPINVMTYGYKHDRPEYLIKKHEKWSKVDYMLYDFFNKKLWKNIKKQDKSFFEELEYFNKVQNATIAYCYSSDTTPLVLDGSKFSHAITITRHYCMRMMRNTPQYLGDVFKRRYDGTEYTIHKLWPWINL
ncbi:galactose-3-O-sulfotransferase 2-like [Branchiostoma lanceolatum]|uniref:galactose-3-O-sulfotransferase 2-like n=1 Tax=Branchiostoma lanceolatum TaxID=7740 RepID=UPI003452568D